MNWIRVKKIANRLMILIFCFTLFLFTMAFPGNSSWLILIFFILLFSVVFLSTLFSWGKTEASLLSHPNQTKDLQLQLSTRFRLPIFIPFLTIRLKIKDKTFEKMVLIYFRNHIQVDFQNILFPRGFYDSLRVESFGKDHFGFFTHHSIKKIPVSFEIYPIQLPPKLKHFYMQKIMANPYFKRYLNTGGTELRQIRDYIPQDAMKHVDWKASSRKRKLMVKEYEKEIQPSITLVFVGGTSKDFEELLRLTYSLYLSLQETLQVQLLLIGSFDQSTLQKEDKFSFLTIEASPDLEALLEKWGNIKIPHGYMIAVSSAELVESMKGLRTEQIIYFTEHDFIDLEVTSPND